MTVSTPSTEIGVTMLIHTRKRSANHSCGTRVIATTEAGHRVVEWWDYNATPEVNHARAATRVAGEGNYAARIDSTTFELIHVN